MSVYLELFHGRKDPKADMDDWGEQGPVFGPLDYVHGTYASDLKFEFNGCNQLTFDSDDLLYYDGMYYGDFSVFSEKALDDNMRKRMVPFDDRKAERPKGEAA